MSATRGEPPVSVLGAEPLEGRRIEETAAGVDLRLREWEAPGLITGITTARAGNFGISTNGTDALLAAYGGLARRLGFGAVAVPRQVHGTDVQRVSGLGVTPGPEGAAQPVLLLAGRVDGLVTTRPGLLLASTAADCVPVFLRDHRARAVGLAHAGWRGVAGGILGRAVEVMIAAGAVRHALEIHLGPAICGACYEVDRPVLEALGLPGERACVDLRGVLATQAAAAGVRTVTVSAHCTRCGSAGLHSHRGSGGQAGRMAAFIGVAIA